MIFSFSLIFFLLLFSQYFLVHSFLSSSFFRSKTFSFTSSPSSLILRNQNENQNLPIHPSELRKKLNEELDFSGEINKLKNMTKFNPLIPHKRINYIDVSKESSKELLKEYEEDIKNNKILKLNLNLDFNINEFEEKILNKKKKIGNENELFYDKKTDSFYSVLDYPEEFNEKMLEEEKKKEEKLKQLELAKKEKITIKKNIHIDQLIKLKNSLNKKDFNESSDSNSDISSDISSSPTSLTTLLSLLQSQYKKEEMLKPKNKNKKDEDFSFEFNIINDKDNENLNKETKIVTESYLKNLWNNKMKNSINSLDEFNITNALLLIDDEDDENFLDNYEESNNENQELLQKKELLIDDTDLLNVHNKKNLLKLNKYEAKLKNTTLEELNTPQIYITEEELFRNYYENPSLLSSKNRNYTIYDGLLALESFNNEKISYKNIETLENYKKNLFLTNNSTYLYNRFLLNNYKLNQHLLKLLQKKLIFHQNKLQSYHNYKDIELLNEILLYSDQIDRNITNINIFNNYLSSEDKIFHNWNKQERKKDFFKNKKKNFENEIIDENNMKKFLNNEYNDEEYNSKIKRNSDDYFKRKFGEDWYNNFLLPIENTVKVKDIDTEDQLGQINFIEDEVIDNFNKKFHQINAEIYQSKSRNDYDAEEVADIKFNNIVENYTKDDEDDEINNHEYDERLFDENPIDFFEDESSNNYNELIEVNKIYKDNSLKNFIENEIKFHNINNNFLWKNILKFNYSNINNDILNNKEKILSKIHPKILKKFSIFNKINKINLLNKLSNINFNLTKFSIDSLTPQAARKLADNPHLFQIYDVNVKENTFKLNYTIDYSKYSKNLDYYNQNFYSYPLITFNKLFNLKKGKKENLLFKPSNYMKLNKKHYNKIFFNKFDEEEYKKELLEEEKNSNITSISYDNYEDLFKLSVNQENPSKDNEIDTGFLLFPHKYQPGYKNISIDAKISSEENKNENSFDIFSEFNELKNLLDEKKSFGSSSNFWLYFGENKDWLPSPALLYSYRDSYENNMIELIENIVMDSKKYLSISNCYILNRILNLYNNLFSLIENSNDNPISELNVSLNNREKSFLRYIKDFLSKKHSEIPNNNINLTSNQLNSSDTDTFLPFPSNEIVPDHMTPDKYLNVNYTSEVIEMKSTTFLLPQIDNDFLNIYEERDFLLSNETQLMDEVVTFSKNYDWKINPDYLPYKIEEEKLPKLLPLLNYIGNSCTLKSTKDDILLFDYHGYISNVIGLQASIKEFALLSYPNLKDLRIETNRVADRRQFSSS